MKFLNGLLFPLLIVPTVRVALFKGLPHVTVQGEELRLRIDDKRSIDTYIETPAKIRAVEGGFQIGEEIYTYPNLKISSPKNLMEVNGKPFEGTLEIQKGGNGLLTVLNEIPLEKYLPGLLLGEIPLNWPKEALKAQVIAARSYALYRKKNPRKKQDSEDNPFYDMETDTTDQVYAGRVEAPSQTGLEEIISETEGEVLWYLGILPSYYHSCCGGETEISRRVWGTKDSSKNLLDTHCKKSPYRNWEVSWTHRQLLDKLKGHGLEGNRIQSIRAETDRISPRNVLVVVETDKMTLFLKATELRRILGYNQLMSTWFNVTADSRQVTFKGQGYGHGVGLCQWGAKGMAENGADYREILNFYYPSAVIKKIY